MKNLTIKQIEVITRKYNIDAKNKLNISQLEHYSDTMYYLLLEVLKENKKSNN